MTRRQDARPAFVRDGTVYAFWRRTLRETRSIYGRDCRPLIRAGARVADASTRRRTGTKPNDGLRRPSKHAPDDRSAHCGAQPRREGVAPRRGGAQGGLSRLARRTSRLRQQAAMFQAEWQIERELALLARGRQPIVAGPWLSEVGFEVLYWIPFLRWFEDRYRVDRERVIAVSRGGSAEWYGDVADRYVEIFDHIDPETFARRNAERRDAGRIGRPEADESRAFDDEILHDGRARSVGLGNASRLPSGADVPPVQSVLVRQPSARSRHLAYSPPSA